MGWKIRLPDGKPLELMTIKPKEKDGKNVASF
jgi:hypothetical protein